MLQVMSLSKHFGSRTLFSDLSWQLNPGDRVGLVGPNGAGKTTLLRLIAGDDAADGGSINCGKEESIGYLPQEAPRVNDGSILERVLGADAAFMALRHRLHSLETQMSAGSAQGASGLAAEMADAIEAFRAMDGYAREARAKEILAGLGFASQQYTAPLSSLSGGWWMRVELARLLLLQPSYLLLDEPTNHLDLATIEWLEGFLQNYPGAWVVVSHDRYFLNRMVQAIAELRPDGMLTVPGNYDDYLDARAALQERLEAETRTFEKKVAHLQQFIDKFRYKASKARQVQSRVKMLDREQAPEKADKARRGMRMQLGDPPRSGDIVYTLDNVSKRYGSKVIYDDFSWQVRRGEKIALVGPNGAGKSTLLKLLTGAATPDRGQLIPGHNVAPYYFAQHQLDILDAKKTVYEQMQSILPLEPIARVRGILGAFLFTQDAVDKKVAVLSGGEKSRLALAQMLAQPYNLLLLDEPTNHLDMDSRDVLESAIQEFSGTVIFISHDRYFINNIATQVLQILPDQPPVAFVGDYDYYLWKSAQEPAAQVAAPTATEKPAKGEDFRARKEEQRALAKRRKETAQLETTIAQQEERMQQIDALLCDSEVFSDAARCQTLTQERAQIEAEVQGLYKRWEAIA